MVASLAMNISGHLPWVPEVLFFLAKQNAKWANRDATAVRNGSSLLIASYIGANLKQPEIGGKNLNFK